MKKIKRPKLIHVKWLDHYSHGDGWGEPDYSECSDGMVCETVGFLMSENKKVMHVALNYAYRKGNPHSSNTICIVKSCIVKKRYIKGME